ncbi:MAG: ATP-binding protein [Saprospiraceae bacterium]|nr:ATP-binding protein [Saprospiraceae bacterium]
MKLTIKNLGKIENCQLELNHLTILVGDNNSGKTYITYSTYGALKYWRDFINYNNFKDVEQKIKSDGQIVLNQGEIVSLVDKCIKNESDKFKRRIRDLFNDKEKIFDTASVKIEFDKPKQFKDCDRKIRVGENISFEGSIKNNSLTIFFKNSSKEELSDSMIRNIVGDLFSMLVFDSIFPDPTIITAERLGISLFYKELDERRNSMIEGLQKLDEKDENMHPIELIMNMSAYYATPIRDHIAFTRNLDNIKKNQTDLDISYPVEIIKEILGAEFKKENKQDIRFYTKNKKNNRFDIPLYLASSSARCIVDIYFYLKHIAKKDDVLIIDEPESHLTLRNQRLMAKLIAAIVNIDIRVFITTHSDFLIKELNNLVLLNNEFPEKEDWLIRNKKIYNSSDKLNHNVISVYQATNGTLSPMKITNKGIEIPFFDDEINSLFHTSSDLDYFIE